MRFEVEARIRRPSGFALEVSFEVDGESLGVVGPSGSGKSTLVAAIAGIEPGARVVLDGRDWTRIPLHRREIGYVGQDPLLFPHLDVRRNLLYSPRAVGYDDVARLLSIGHLLDRMPRHLSGGERRRVALARALAGRPRLLLLDEPFGGLDEVLRRDAMSLLDRVRRTLRVPMVLVSHWADEIVALTDRVLRLDGGRLVSQGPSATVLAGGETRVDTYLAGTVVAPDRVRVEGVELAAMLPPGAAGDVRLACYANDVVLTRQVPAEVSARNVLPVEVLSVTDTTGAVLVELGPPRLFSIVTHAAADGLDLVPGLRVHAVVKATSIAYLGPS